AIVTNIDADHLSTYGGDFVHLRSTFLKFLHHLPFYGLAVLCVDDLVVRVLAAQVWRPLRTSGFYVGVAVRAVAVSYHGTRTRFRVEGKDGLTMEVDLNLPGRHNVLNALAAITIAHELGVSEQAMQEALSGFRGVGRRFQSYGEFDLGGRQVLLVD